MKFLNRAYKAFFSAAAVLLICTCQLFNGIDALRYTENNPNGFAPVELSDSALEGNLFRLSFGTSARAAGDLGQNTNQGMGITMNPDGSVLLKAVNTSNNAGKIAGSEDGIAYFYTEVDKSKNFRLSADFEVHTFGFSNSKPDLNGQEAFGLMARDYVPQYPGFTMEEVRYATNGGYYTGLGRPDAPGGSGNMVMVGGVKRGVRMYWRTGVTDPVGDAIENPDTVADASKAKFYYMPRELPDYSKWSSTSERSDFPTAGTKWSLYLEKTNNGFKGSITPPSNKGVKPNTKRDDVILGETYEYELLEPDLLFSINKEKYYVGFFASRDAMVTLRNWHYEEAAVEDCAPRVDPVPDLVSPTFTVASPAFASGAGYTYYARSNMEGVLSLTLNGTVLQSRRGVWKTEKTNASAVPFSLFEVPLDSLVAGDNTFRAVFTPDKEQPNWAEFQGPLFAVGNTNALTNTFVVNYKTYGGTGGEIWAANNGRPGNAGTYDSPLDIDTAIAYIQPGQTIKLKNGRYSRLAVLIPRYNDGTATLKKRMEAETRNEVVFDFATDIFREKDVKGFELNGNYWELEGFHLTNTANKVKGMNVGGSNNIVRWVKAYFNGDTGIQIAGASTEPKSMWPSNNRIEFCESFSNMDKSREDADGFASKLTSGEGNVFYWCIGHHNADDGWDLFSKKETGNIGAVFLDHCIAYSNGRFLQTGTIVNDEGIPVPHLAEESTHSGGNGFKMGGEGLPVLHLAKDCLSFNNDADGFTSNSDPAILLTQCTSFNNGRTVEENAVSRPGNFAIYGAGSAATTGLDAVVTQVVSLYTLPGPTASDRLEIRSPASGYKWDHTVGATVNTSGRKLTVTDNVVNSVPPFTADGFAPWSGEVAERFEGTFLNVDQDNGHYILNGFAQLKNIIGTMPGATGLWD
ncbi:MAG: hypothetical protein LBN21_11805 [Treponema sp.]|jgi:hypothetical protein|nr:hypothetical protein [Treponema sp.]